MAEELRACPKCGHEALMTKSQGKVPAFSVKCSICNNKTKWYADEGEAINDWNGVSEPEDPSKPKRCPFCGGLAKVYNPTSHSSAGGSYYVMCNECLTSGNNYSTAEKAIKAWNRRINE